MFLYKFWLNQIVVRSLTCRLFRFSFIYHFHDKFEAQYLRHLKTILRYNLWLLESRTSNLCFIAKATGKITEIPTVDPFKQDYNISLTICLTTYSK